MEKDAKIYIAGHRGLVGSAILNELQKQGYQNFLLKTHSELDLSKQNEALSFFESEKPKYVFLAAAKVGGILANDTYSADFIYENLMIQTNVIHAAHLHNAKKLLFLGSSCIYPKFATQPLKEEALLTGILEPTNEAYAIAKIAGLKMCTAYRKQYGSPFFSVMPTNLYGPGDNFDLETSHVLPALIHKFHEAKVSNAESVELWGSGNPKREFLYSEDLGKACVFIMQNATVEETPDLINIGTGEDLSIRELADLIQKIVGFEGGLIWDSSKPDGTPRKLMDVSRLEAMGWKAETSLKDGIQKTYTWYLENI